MGLLKHELYKIFSNRILYIALFFFTLVTIYLYPDDIQRSLGSVRYFYKEYYQQFEGPVTEDKVKLAGEYFEKKPEVDNPAQEVSRSMHSQKAVYFEILKADQRLSNQQALLKSLVKRLHTMENNGQDDYEYKEIKLHYNMVKDIKTSVISFNWGWREASDFINTLGTVIMGVMILLGVSTVFSNEYSTNMDALILSSKNGKSRVITAKLLASGIFIVIVALFFTLLNLLIQFKIMGFTGGNSTLQSLFRYENSPYGWTLVQYIPRQIAAHLFGSLAFGFIVLLVSSLCKSGLASFFISSFIFGLPLFFNSILCIKTGWITKINEFSYAILMRGQPLFSEFKAFNILGHPVLYLNLMLVLFTLLSIAVIYLTYRSFRSHQVS